MPRLKVNVTCGVLPLIQPFRIAGHRFESWERIVVTIEDGTCVGRGEAAGVFFLGETAATMRAQIEAARDAIEAGVTRERLCSILPAGGARNAVDCALWDLEASRAGQPVWRLAGVPDPCSLVTTFTLGADDPETMAQAARDYAQARAIKIKLTGHLALDVERVCAIRAARPDAWLGVDGNQGFERDQLDALIPALVQANVALLEQPLARGSEAQLEGLGSPIPIAGDESTLTLEDVRTAPGRFQVINIKLDKCGGLTEGLRMAAEARNLGLGVMVGTMICTSLGTAPGFVLGQVADFVDLDGSILLTEEHARGAIYRDGKLFVEAAVWGA